MGNWTYEVPDTRYPERRIRAFTTCEGDYFIGIRWARGYSHSITNYYIYTRPEHEEHGAWGDRKLRIQGEMTIPLEGEGLGLVGKKKGRVDSVFDASAAAHSIGPIAPCASLCAYNAPGHLRILRLQNFKTGLGRPRAEQRL